MVFYPGSSQEKTDERINLVFEGLNCFADIYVNDIKSGSSENALIPHSFDVTDQLLFGSENKITAIPLESIKLTFL